MSDERSWYFDEDLCRRRRLMVELHNAFDARKRAWTAEHVWSEEDRRLALEASCAQDAYFQRMVELRDGHYAALP